MNGIRQALQRLPSTLKARLRHLALWPPLFMGRFAMLGRRQPISRTFGFERGCPIDRFYIEKFLAQSVEDIRGHILEIADATYTRQFGDADAISQVDILHATEGNPLATLVGDLSSGNGIPEATFDCIILTQTLPFIYDLHGVVMTLFGALKPNGVVLATSSGITQISRYDEDRWGDYWRLTPRSAKRLFSDVFGEKNVSVTAYGNVTAAVGFLHGLAVVDIGAHALEPADPDYPVLLGIRAVKH